MYFCGKKSTGFMDNVNNSINEIFSNWNMSSKQKGDKYYTLAKQLDLGEVNRLKCTDLAIEQYEKTTDESCLCNLAHCYFIKAHLSEEEADDWYKKSIETHIAGSRDKTYQNQEFYRFYSVDNGNIDSVLTKIMLSHPSRFNDPVDCPIAQEKGTDHLFPNKNVFDGLKVCCFGKVDFSRDRIQFSVDSKKWAYYGNKHTGICIRYCFFPNDLEKALSNKFVFKKVEYKSSFSFKRGIVADGLLSKSVQYEEENEWRIVWYDRNYGDNPYYDADKDSLLVPINLYNIICIYVGYHCPNNITRRVIEFAKQKKDVPLYVYRIHPNPENLFSMVKTQIYPIPNNRVD